LTFTGAHKYDADDGTLRMSVLKSGEKHVYMEADREVLEVLVRFMYTGTLQIPPRQTPDLLQLAQLLGMPVVVNVIQVRSLFFDQVKFTDHVKLLHYSAFII
jgi:hypothetical protein